jgi:hypothetical protein
MEVTSTLSRQGATTERNLVLPNFVYYGLRNTAQSQNKEFSQGKLLYEILHFDREKPCTDDISKVEEFVDRQLSEELGEQSQQLVDKIKIIDAHGKSALSNEVPDDLDPDENSNTQVRVRLPDETWEQVHDEKERYIGDWLAPSVIKFQESAFNSRMERINCKRELVDYLQGEVGVETMESEVAYACVTGDSDRFDGVGEVHDLLERETATEWPEDITVDELREMSTDELQRVSLGQKSKSGRVRALETAIRNDGRQPNYEEVQVLVKEVYGVKTDQTARSYVDQMEMTWLGDVRVVQMVDLLESVKSTLLQAAVTDGIEERVEKLSLEELFCISEDSIREVEGYYADMDGATEAVDEFFEREQTDTLVNDVNISQKGRESLKKQLTVLKEEGFAPMNKETKIKQSK